MSTALKAPESPKAVRLGVATEVLPAEGTRELPPDREMRLQAGDLLKEAAVSGKLTDLLVSLAAKPARAPHYHQPSVGTWLMPATTSKTTKDTAELPTLDQEMRLQAGELLKVAVDSGRLFDIMKSLAPQPMQDPYYHQPSVGTWLMPAKASKSYSPQSPSAPVDPPSASVLERTHTEMLQLPHEELIRSFREELAKRDDEIAELRRLVSQRP
jgi:hypothetical protein